MPAVWMRVRADARARWRAWLALAVLVGIASGASIAAAAGARRTESAYPRFLDSHESYDVTFGGTGESKDINVIAEKIMALPQVAKATRMRFASAAATLPSGREVGFPDFVALVDPLGRDGVSISRWKILEGRAPNPNRPDEAVIPFNSIDKLGLHVGDVVRIQVGDPFADPATAPKVPVRIVGVIVQPGSMPVIGSVTFAGVSLSPAFAKAHADALPPRFEDGPSVVLKHRSDIGAFLAEVAKIDPIIDIPSKLPEHISGVRRTLRFEVLALWALAALVALAGMAIVGQAIARQVYLGAEDHPTLRSLGMDRRQLTEVSIAAALAIAVIGILIAAGVAYLGSWLTPIGLARVAEPDPGFAFDPLMYLIGACLTLAGVLLATAIPAWRASGHAWAARSASSTGWSGARAGVLPVAASTGIRMAFSAGRRGDAVPVRSAVLGSMIGIGALVAALIFAASLQHLIHTPRLSGYTWDTTITAEESGGELYKLLSEDRDVQAWTLGGIWNVDVAGTSLQSLLYEAGKPIRPGVVAGRAPATVDEVALGASTMRAAHARIGGFTDIVFPADQDVPGSKPKTVRMRVVGTVVIPPFFFQSGEPGTGVAMTLEALMKNDPSVKAESEQIPALVRLRPGVNLENWLAGYKEKIRDLFTINKREPGAELLSLGRVSGLPMALAGILGVLAAGALAHALLTSIRRRRRELAILKTLGFVGGQVRGAVRWQSLTMTIVAIVVGLPVGIVAGRLLWLLFAGDIGVIPEALIPAVAFIVAPAALLLAVLLASLPARSAARTQPALVLRTE
jgi:hypothetical protein